jgi:hypothetical protein
LEVKVYNDATGKTIYTSSAVASCDDAFPLMSTSSPVALLSPATKVSSNLGLVFNINNIAAGDNQNSVEIHVGTVPYHGQKSYDSESCLVVSQINFLTPLENFLTSLAGTSVTGLQELSDWINTNVSCQIDSTVSITQPQLNVAENLSAQTFDFNITRPIYSTLFADSSIPHLPTSHNLFHTSDAPTTLLWDHHIFNASTYTQPNQHLFCHTPLFQHQVTHNAIVFHTNSQQLVFFNSQVSANRNRSSVRRLDPTTSHTWVGWVLGYVHVPEYLWFQ